MRASLLNAVALGIVFTLVCPGPAQGDWKTVNTGFKVKNRHKTKTLTSWKIEMTGDGEFGATDVTDGDGTPLTGFTKKVTNKPGKVIIELTGGNLPPGDAQNIIVWFNGTYHGNSGVVKDYKEDVQDDLSTVQERAGTVFTDSEVLFGGPEGRTFLGVEIPPETYGFFYQITNEDPVETVHILALNLGCASEEPFAFGGLDFPHDGVRETHEEDEDTLVGREAQFEELGLEPGVPPLVWDYDPAAGQVIADFGPGICPGQSSNVFYFFCDQTCNARSLPESELLMGSGPATVQCLVPSLGGPWEEPFDVYEVGSSLHGQGRWKGWDNDPAFDAIVSDVQARSAPHSVEIAGSSDLVQELDGFTGGKWQFTAWQYIPGDFSSNSGEPFAGTYFILLNSYVDGGPHEESDWSVQMNFDSNDGMLKIYYGDGLNTVDVPYIPDEWVELQVVIDLDEDLTQIYYDDAFVVEYSWTGGVLGGGAGALNIGAVDLFANQSTSVFWDDLSLEPYVPECPGDLDGDNDVDLSDLAQLLAHYGMPSGAEYEDGDLDGDGDVDLSDLAGLLAVYGTICD